MDVETLRTLLLWCTVINYVFLFVWFLVYLALRKHLYRKWRMLFRMTDEQFDMGTFAAMAAYKIGVFLFNLVPYLALRFAM